MSIGIGKTIVVTAFSVILFGLALPLGFWFVVMLVDRWTGLPAVLHRPASQILSAASILVGIFWVSWSYSYLVFVGRGLPLEAFGRAVHPTRYLVTTGPYAYTRNPMVLGMLFILLGVALLRGSVPGIILVGALAVIVALYLVAFEEKGLRERFGREYEEYRASVPLLIPRLSPYVHEVGEKA